MRACWRSSPLFPISTRRGSQPTRTNIIRRRQRIMRSFRHWTPRYIKNRLADAAYQRNHPDHPWLTQQAVSILSTYLRPTDVGVETGSGRSTVWFARHVGRLISIEHHQDWYGRVQAMLRDAGLTNVDYRLAPLDVKEEEGERSGYVAAMRTLETASLDFALIDGVYRDSCAWAALPLLKPGGLLVIDNVNWFFPSQSYSPNSRRVAQGASTPTWNEAYRVVSAWRSIWTSSGVSDTALYFKPLAT